MRRLPLLSMAILLALLGALAGSVSARPVQAVIEVQLDHAKAPLERTVTLDIQVPSNARNIQLHYEQLSFGAIHTIHVPITDKRATVVIPTEHTTQPGLRYWWEIDTGRGVLTTEESYIPFISDMEPLSVGTHIAHDMERANGYLPDGTYVPPGKGRIPHGRSAATTPVTSKLLEVRNFGVYVHYGVDFQMPEGNHIRAMEAGTVHESEPDTGAWGQYVMIRHANSKYYTLYAHLSDRWVQKGQVVSKGQIIGLSGNTGNSTGPHLHTSYHIYHSGKRVELYPFRYFMDSLGGYPAAEFDYIQTPVNNYDPSSGTNVSVNVYGKGAGTPWVKIVWRRKGTSTWTESNMTQTTGTTIYRYWWHPSHQGRTMEYYIKAGKSTTPTTHWVTRPAKFHSGNPGQYYEIYVDVWPQ